jgi:hypothetical protein
MLLLKEGQMNESWETLKKQHCLADRGTLDRRVFSLFRTERAN